MEEHNSMLCNTMFRPQFVTCFHQTLFSYYTRIVLHETRLEQQNYLYTT